MSLSSTPTLIKCAVCFQEKVADLMRSSDTCHECSERWRLCEKCTKSTVSKSWRDRACPSCGYKPENLEIVKDGEVHHRGFILDMKNFMITLNIVAAILYGLVLAEENPSIHSAYDVFAWLLPVAITGINVLYLGAYEAPLRSMAESEGKEKKESILALWLKVKRKQLEDQLR